jgi:hypothetical protein
MGIGAERIVGGALADLRTAFEKPSASVAAMAEMVKAHQLTGISWDIEVRTSSWVQRVWSVLQWVFSHQGRGCYQKN